MKSQVPSEVVRNSDTLRFICMENKIPKEDFIIRTVFQLGLPIMDMDSFKILDELKFDIAIDKNGKSILLEDNHLSKLAHASGFVKRIFEGGELFKLVFYKDGREFQTFLMDEGCRDFLPEKHRESPVNNHAPLTELYRCHQIISEKIDNLIIENISVRELTDVLITVDRGPSLKVPFNVF